MILKTMAILSLGVLVAAGENRDYKTWSSCKIGSWIKLKTEMDQKGSPIVSEQILTLVELAPGKVTLEQTGTVTGKGKTVKLPVKKIDITPEEDAQGKVVRKGDEDVTVGGKKVKCHWEEIETEAEGAKTLTKMWTTLEVPGGLVKLESRAAGAAAPSLKLSLVEWEKK